MSNDLVVIEQQTAITAFNDGKVDDVLDKIEREVRSIVTDISTEKGRKEIASIARKIASTKVAMDDMGKQLKEDAKKKCDAIDAERRKITKRLDALKEEFRKPLTEWEQAEQLRIDGHEAAIQRLYLPRTCDHSLDTPDYIQGVIDELHAFNAGRDWQEFKVRATMEFNITKDLLQATAKRREKEIADAAELERLRKEKEERDQKERDEKIAAEAAEKAKREAEEKAGAEAKRAAAEAEEKRLAEVKAREDAEAEARKAKERAEQAERDKKAAEEKAEQDRIAAEKEAQERAEKARQEERDRIAAEEKRQKDEAAKREADTAHKKKINNEALSDLMKHTTSVSESALKDVIKAIAKGEIRHVKISY